MIAFLTSSPCVYQAPRAIINPENCFLVNLLSCLPENPRCLFVASAPDDAGFTDRVAEEMEEVFPHLTIHVYEIVNEFFGELITVSGLLTGQDILKQLNGKALGSRLLLPQNVLRSGEEVFLDDYTKTELENSLQVPINIVKSSGHDFIQCVLGEE